MANTYSYGHCGQIRCFIKYLFIYCHAKGFPRNTTYCVVPPTLIQTVSTAISCGTALYREQTGFGSLRTHLLWIILK